MSFDYSGYNSVTDVATSSGVKMLIYGRSGIGKTMLSCTAPNPVIGSAEPGLLSLSAKNQRRVFGKVVEFPTVEIADLNDLRRFRDSAYRSDFPFETIILDSISEIGERILKAEKLRNKDPRKAYGEMQEQVIDILKDFRDLPKRHVVFVAKECANREGSTPLNIPMMPGKQVGPALPYLMDEVLHLDIGKLEDGSTYRYFQTVPDINFDAKDRSGALEAIEEPNLSTVIDKITRQ